MSQVIKLIVVDVCSKVAYHYTTTRIIPFLETNKTIRKVGRRMVKAVHNVSTTIDALIS